ncbi:MAG: pilus assembly protein PilM [Romboutsia sp.]
MINKKIINIEINDAYIKILFLKKHKKSVSVEKTIIKPMNSPNEYINNKILDNVELYKSEIVKTIKTELGDKNKGYKEIYYNMQNEDILIRNISILNVKNKKDIKSMIEFEITQYIPINIKNYIMEYKILNSNGSNINLKLILVPIIMANLCYEISDMLNMKPKKLSVNFDILQKIIDLDLIEDICENAVFIEDKGNEFILSLAKNRIIDESYILHKSPNSYESVLNLTKDFDTVYYYGIEDEVIIKNIETLKNFKKLELKEAVISKDENDKMHNLEYINGIGMII